MVVRRDGTFSISIEVEGFSVAIGGGWNIVGGKLITTWTLAGETKSASESYAIRGNRLTLVNDEDDMVSVWERQ